MNLQINLQNNLQKDVTETEYRSEKLKLENS